ncbi:MAG: ribosomal protein S18-alanine N-acetyltransferase [Clostridia bacterium]|nr:ribosomal protein S18-alanine N-acetyltransferase [Clostridia bacterium]
MSEEIKKQRAKHHPRLLTASSADLEGTAVLEKLCFHQPWSASSLELLTKEGIGVGYLCTQASAGAENPMVTAYGGMLIAVDEGQITNIAVHPEHRGQGLGLAIVQALIKHAKAEHLATITLEVRVSNTPAISLYRKVGFAEVGRRKGFYTKPTEDALIMELKLK